MFSQITIRGLGPHDNTTIDIDPTGTTHIEGGSECGKSTLAEAVCFVLWGAGIDGKALDVDAIRDGHKAVDVTLTTAKGATLRRRMTRSRKTERTVDGEAYTTEAAWQEKTRGLQKSLGGQTAGYLALAPFSWVPLADDKQGKPLRDLLAALVPGSDRDEVGRLMTEAGHELRSEDPIEEKYAVENRKDAKKHRDRCAGALREAEAAIPEPFVGATLPDPEPARAVLAAVEAWTTYRAAEARHADAYEAQTRWDTGRAELGERPEADEAALQAATSKAAVARQSLRHAEDVQRKAEQDADTARKALDAPDRELVKAKERLVGLQGDGPCPTCGQDRPHEVDPAELAKAEAALATAQTEAKARAKALRDKVFQAEARVSEAAKECEIRRGAAKSAEAYLEQVKIGAARVEDYDRSRRLLGSRPTLPPMPVSPEGAEPTREAVAEARALITRAERATGAAEQAARARKAALARADEARKKLAAAEAEVERQEALVDAVRRAPGERLRRGMEALDFGPVSVEIEETGVKVLIDGRGWRRASKGRQVVADLAFRLALRRAAGMKWLPIFVDEVQSWSGEWPEADGPVVYLTTTTGAIRVAGMQEAA